jgi:hypothetical protein
MRVLLASRRGAAGNTQGEKQHQYFQQRKAPSILTEQQNKIIKDLAANLSQREA